MRLARLWGVRAAAVTFAALVTAPALAEEPVETSVKTWVASIDASTAWQATYGGLVVDTVTGNATLTDLVVNGESSSFRLKFGRVVVQGYQQTADGTFAAREIDVDDGRIDAGAYSVRLDHAALETPSLPTTAGFVWDDAQPFASLARVIEPLMQATVPGATVGKITVVETLLGIQTWSTYRQVKLEGLRGGKIAAMSAGPLRTDSPGVDPAGPPAEIPPLVSMHAASAETTGIDLGAMQAVYDPARYINGVGDGVWRTSVAHTAYRDVGIDIPNIAVKMEGVTFDDFRMRQPKAPLQPPAADDPGKPLPQSVLDRLRTLAPFGVGRFELTNLDIASPGIDRMHLGKLTLADASIDAIGAFGIEGAEGAIGGQGSLKVGKFGFGGLTLPTIDALSAALAAHDAGGDVDYSSLVPPIGFVEIGGIDVGLTDLPAMKLDQFRVDLGNYSGHLPTAISGTLAGLQMPAALIPDERTQKLLAQFGYDRVSLAGGGKMTWGGDGTISVRDFSAGMKDVGSFSGSFDLTGLTPADAEHLGDPSGAIDRLSLAGGTFSFTDDSIVGRVLTAQATQAKIDPAKFREQFAKGLPFMLMFLNNRDLQAQLTPVLQSVIRTGGTITANAKPASPVTFRQLIDTVKTAPWNVFDMLKISVSGAPSANPPPTEPSAN